MKNNTASSDTQIVSFLVFCTGVFICPMALTYAGWEIARAWFPHCCAGSESHLICRLGTQVAGLGQMMLVLAVLNLTGGALLWLQKNWAVWLAVVGQMGLLALCAVWAAVGKTTTAMLPELLTSCLLVFLLCQIALREDTEQSPQLG